MALIYQKVADGKTYQVRNAGRSLRLYTNGAFHSQYSPQVLFTGGVWDLLSLPCLFAQQLPKKILMLGVGGGTALHQLASLTAPAQMIGVEWDQHHLDIATRFFGLTYPNLNLIQADAFQWLKTNRQRHDLIIDDLFVDAATDPERPFAIDGTWLNRLEKRISSKGLIIQNHLEKKTALAAARYLSAMMGGCLLFTLPKYHNVVLAAYREPLDLKAVKALVEQRIEARLAAFPGSKRNRLRYSVQQIS